MRPPATVRPWRSCRRCTGWPTGTPGTPRRIPRSSAPATSSASISRTVSLPSADIGQGRASPLSVVLTRGTNSPASLSCSCNHGIAYVSLCRYVAWVGEGLFLIGQVVLIRGARALRQTVLSLRLMPIQEQEDAANESRPGVVGGQGGDSNPSLRARRRRTALCALRAIGGVDS